MPRQERFANRFKAISAHIMSEYKEIAFYGFVSMLSIIFAYYFNNQYEYAYEFSQAQFWFIAMLFLMRRHLLKIGINNFRNGWKNAIYSGMHCMTIGIAINNIVYGIRAYFVKAAIGGNYDYAHRHEYAKQCSIELEKLNPEYYSIYILTIASYGLLVFLALACFSSMDESKYLKTWYKKE